MVYASNFSKCIIGNLSDDFYPANLKILKKTQNKILRAIFRLRKYNKDTKSNTPTSPLYKQLDVLKLKDLYLYNLSLLCFDYFNSSGLPTRIKDLFKLKTSVTSRTSSSKVFDFYYDIPNLNSTFKRPCLAAAAFWNSLPFDFKATKSKNSFKCKMKKYFTDKY